MTGSFDGRYMVDDSICGYLIRAESRKGRGPHDVARKDRCKKRQLFLLENDKVAIARMPGLIPEGWSGRTFDNSTMPFLAGPGNFVS